MEGRPGAKDPLSAGIEAPVGAGVESAPARFRTARAPNGRAAKTVTFRRATALAASTRRGSYSNCRRAGRVSDRRIRPRDEPTPPTERPKRYNSHFSPWENRRNRLSSIPRVNFPPTRPPQGRRRSTRVAKVKGVRRDAATLYARNRTAIVARPQSSSGSPQSRAASWPRRARGGADPWTNGSLISRSANPTIASTRSRRLH